MNQRITLRKDKLLSFADAGNLSGAVDEKIFKFGQNNNDGLVSTSVNNYLKTPEEVEADFCFVINSRRAFHEKEDGFFDTYGRSNTRTDGNMNTQGLAEILTGPMEENY